MYGFMLFLATVIGVAVVVLIALGIRSQWRAMRASGVTIKRGEVDHNHREMARLLDAMLVQDEMVPYLDVHHRDLAKQLVDEFHSP